MPTPAMNHRSSPTFSAELSSRNTSGIKLLPMARSRPAHRLYREHDDHAKVNDDDVAVGFFQDLCRGIQQLQQGTQAEKKSLPW